MQEISYENSSNDTKAGVLENESLIEQFVQELCQNGAVVLDDRSGFFSDEEWAALETFGLLSGLPYETVDVGDAGEPNKVEVGRLMTDVEQPLVVNESISKKMLKIICAPSRLKFMENLLGISPLSVRRAQINKMHAGSFIGRHVDQDSNPDYEVSIVLQFGRAFDGGEFIIQLPDGSQNVIVPTFRSITITRCDFAHEVRPVLAGTRTSLVYFVSRHAGLNRRYLSEAAVGSSASTMA
ncbi:2OG-Fe(II) oxygenase (plasmid) [Massilia forsythiae]|uniref:2OG-Fe(II) oxygenase n=1 Tax=Massilia forsythiae TaxID=2728020 RepID=A0A7Z2ZX06_9BURK|nr:2OG-Fe(II) oxygenase [Massilia forsythiae]QJE03672.1 2OG-Fe(II) oxygenase [Massilia forsythiae]